MFSLNRIISNLKTKGLSETAGSLFVYFAQLPSEVILVNNIFKQ